VATMLKVSVRELKTRLSHYLRQLERGESFTVTRRGKPVALMAPAPGREDSLRRKATGLAAMGVISWSGQKPAFAMRRAELRGEGLTIAEMVIRDRR